MNVIFVSDENLDETAILNPGGHSIIPIQLKNGGYFLPLTVLEDQHLSDYHAHLSSLPQIEITEDDLIKVDLE